MGASSMSLCSPVSLGKRQSASKKRAVCPKGPLQGGRVFGDESGFRPERAGVKRRGFFKLGKRLGGSEQDAIRNQRAVLAGKAVAERGQPFRKGKIRQAGQQRRAIVKRRQHACGEQTGFIQSGRHARKNVWRTGDVCGTEEHGGELPRQRRGRKTGGGEGSQCLAAIKQGGNRLHGRNRLAFAQIQPRRIVPDASANEQQKAPGARCSAAIHRAL